MRIIHFAIILLVYFLVAIDESINTILLESTNALNAKYNNYLVYGYLLLSVFGALLLAGWSDFHCRRKTIIFAYCSIITSSIIITLYNSTGQTYLAFIALIIKATFGNALPVALALLADITPKKSLRSIIAGAIVAVSIGIWIPIYIRPAESHNTQLSFLFSIIAFITLIFIYKFLKDDYFDNIQFQKNTASFSKFVTFLKKDTVHLYIFFITPIVAIGITYFTISEISYYQPLLRGELLLKNSYFSNQSLVLAIGYYLGIFILILSQFLFKKRQISDSTWLKSGAIITLLALIILIAASYFNFFKPIIMYSLLGIFSLGYAFRDPTLYSALSKACALEDQGKVFGAFDSSESLATIISSVIITQTKALPIFVIFSVTLVIYLIALPFLFWFIKILYKKQTQ